MAAAAILRGGRERAGTPVPLPGQRSRAAKGMRQNVALVLKGSGGGFARHGSHVFQGITRLQCFKPTFLRSPVALHCFVLLSLFFFRTYVILEV